MLLSSDRQYLLERELLHAQVTETTDAVRMVLRMNVINVRMYAMHERSRI